MKLSALANGFPHRQVGPPGDPEVRGVTHDSRRTGAGILFAALPGKKLDGRSFVAEAVLSGAPAALGPAPAPDGVEVPYLEVENPRLAAGHFAARLAGDPSGKLVMAGVTGTSGKTTTTLLVDEVLGGAHPKRGLFGTLVYRWGEGTTGTLDASRTTPEATELQPMLAALTEWGGTAATLECSSHALWLERLAGCTFDVAVFLNLTRDHLDDHGTMEAYFEEKAKLFALLKPAGRAVVNADDAWGRKLLARLPKERTLSFSLLAGAGADITGEVRPSAEGISLRVVRRETGEVVEIASPLVGAPNAENLLAAASAALALGLSPIEIGARLGSVSKVPGRLEMVPNELGLLVLVDYAHKPAALEGVLKTTRALASSRGGALHVVFGCGGDRDRGKRPEMGRIAAELADRVVVTSDNPRSEEPSAIAAEVSEGVRAAGREAIVVLDRREAIVRALEAAEPGDVVVVAGKGHETYQVTAGRKEPFDDRLVARETLAELERARGEAKK
ncbi:MAG TPA: UDP-N-acetylmuramoyl-L-alanyl-D-glutamate--2,6-diaminopimelate ligase [Thermoanaerobaculia bacterium]|nr:UDP-N-acetylmuramoyl-L-alanyl-D-glutamate--2,6-diaminopimelate ligase [Thermoanaerobaculia bacterium]